MPLTPSHCDPPNRSRHGTYHSRISAISYIAPAILLFSGCQDSRQKVVETYVSHVRLAYQDTLNATMAMDDAIQAFADAPSETSLETAKQAWLDARLLYGQTEVFRFYGGPIDAEETGPEGFINAWPLDEAYIDYVAGNESAGVINQPDAYPELTIDVLLGLNERGGETNISTGYHAIEFLLWGQDFSETGPGARPAADYIETDQTGAANQARRAEYLRLVSALLVTHLTQVHDAWMDTSSTAYAPTFLANASDSALQNILIGMGSLAGAELAGERLYTAYESRDQEDEHSCFSDNTHNDLYANALGIQNVWEGRWGATTGTGLKALVAEKDPELEATMTTQLEAVISAISAIPVPFDQHLTAPDTDPGRIAMITAVEALEDFTDQVVLAAEALGLTIKIGT